MDETFVPEKHATLRNLLIGLGVFAAALFIGGFVFIFLQPSPHRFFPESEELSIESLNKDQKYFYTEILRADNRTFVCRELRYTESSCELFLLDSSTTTYLGISVDNPGYALKPSPDKKYILIVTEQEGVLLDTFSLEKKIVIQVPKEESLGVWSSLPSFIPKTKWLDNSQIEFSIYRGTAFDDLSPSPDEVRVIDIATTSSQSSTKYVAYTDPVYINNQYGFQVKVPATWTKYAVSVRQEKFWYWDAILVKFALPLETGAFVEYSDDPSTRVFDIDALVIMPVDYFESHKNDCAGVDGPCRFPLEITRDNTYVFAWINNPLHNDNYCAGEGLAKEPYFCAVRSDYLIQGKSFLENLILLPQK
jgi:hypothetical protein